MVPFNDLAGCAALGAEGLTCPGLLSCFGDTVNDWGCSDQSCVQEIYETCASQGKTAYEKVAFVDFLNCYAECQSDGSCVFTTCVDEYAACYGGPVHESQTCSQLSQCMQVCKKSNAWSDCEYGCLESASQEAVNLWFARQMCGQAACLGAANIGVCAQEKMKPGEICHAEATDCANDG